MPHKPQYKHRFRCWRCDFRGDVFDLLRHFHPDGNYWHRKAQVAELLAEYERTGNGHATSSSSGERAGNHGGEPAKPKPDRRALEVAWANCTAEELDTLALAHKLAQREGVNLADLAEHCADFNTWVEELENEHLAECTESDCDAIGCRRKRGLPPMTPEEIDADRRARGLPTRHVRQPYRASAMERARIMSIADSGDRACAALVYAVPELLERLPGLVSWWKHAKATSLAHCLVTAAEIAASWGTEFGMSLEAAADYAAQYARERRSRDIAEKVASCRIEETLRRVRAQARVS